VYEHLWLGVDRRIEEALHYYLEMGKALQPPENTHWNVALMAAGAVLDTRWQDRFYTSVSTFLAKARSVPSIIEACFGKDSGIRHIPPMMDWWGGLTADERRRREEFSDQFRADNKAFRDHDLTKERDACEHRRGFANVEGEVVGFFGTKHIARPDLRIPPSECRELGPNEAPALAFLLRPRPIDPPRWDKWTICGKPLFEASRAYLQLASEIRGRAQVICDSVHSGKHLSTPPT
jgi:hypothetical protein